MHIHKVYLLIFVFRFTAQVISGWSDKAVSNTPVFRAWFSLLAECEAIICFSSKFLEILLSKELISQKIKSIITNFHYLFGKLHQYSLIWKILNMKLDFFFFFALSWLFLQGTPFYILIFLSQYRLCTEIYISCNVIKDVTKQVMNCVTGLC